MTISKADRVNYIPGILDSNAERKAHKFVADLLALLPNHNAELLGDDYDHVNVTVDGDSVEIVNRTKDYFDYYVGYRRIITDGRGYGCVLREYTDKLTGNPRPPRVAFESDDHMYCRVYSSGVAEYYIMANGSKGNVLRVAEVIDDHFKGEK